MLLLEEIIDVEWSDRKLRQAAAQDRAGRKLLGGDRWSAFKRRLRTLEVADCLCDVLSAPGRFHPLSARRDEEWAASLTANWRLIFEPADLPLPRKADGSLDVNAVKRVRILRVEDYHGR